MEKQSKSDRILKIINTTLIVVYIITIILAFFFKDNMTYDFENENLHFDDGWELINEDGSRSPAPSPITIDNDKIIIAKTLPTVNDNTILTFEVTHKYCKATIEDEVIYEGSKSTLGGLSTNVGNYNILVHLRAEDSGKEIKVEIVRRDTVYPLSLKNMFISSRDAYALHTLTANILTVIFAIIFIFIGLVSFIVCIILKTSKFEDKRELFSTFFYLGCFTILIALWTSGNLSFVGILTGKLTLSGIINYVSFMTLPVVIIGLIKSLIKTDNKLINYIEFENIIVLTFILFTFLTGLIDLSKTLFISHINDILTVIALIVFFVLISKDKSKENKNKTMTVGFTILGILFTGGIILYLIDADYLTMINVSCFASIVTLFVVCLIKLYDATTAALKNKEYYYYAYNDELTGLKNRKAYTEKLDGLKEIDFKCPVYFVALDINNLKGANDNYGHLAGDNLIKDTANLITDIFNNFGTCFRVGGDEFMVLVDKEIESIDLLLNELKERSKDSKTEDGLPISIAYGYSVKEYGEELDLHKLVTEADINMYQNKKDYYSKENNDRRKQSTN